MNEGREKMDIGKAGRVISEVMGGARKHESLAQASSYALLLESQEVANLLHDKLMERNKLINELVALNVESAGALLPGVPVDSELAAFMAIEDLAKVSPDLHPILGRVAELEKLKYLVGGGSFGVLN